MLKGWIGVDLDGTLAEYDYWHGDHHIGRPIPAMVERVRKWLSEGQEVRIFTARACGNDIEPIKKWCLKHIGCELPITCVKDYGMIELWDDRAIQVIPNKGVAIQELMAKL
jgi:hypothetical protein